MSVKELSLTKNISGVQNLSLTPVGLNNIMEHIIALYILFLALPGFLFSM